MDRLDVAEIRRQSHRASIVTASGAIIIIAAIAFAVFTVYRAETQVAILKTQKANLNAEIADLSKKRDQARAEWSVLSQAIANANGIAQDKRVTTKELVQSVKATSLVQAAPAGATRRNITVTIYAKSFEQDVNQSVLLPKLQNLGFVVHMAPGRNALARIPTNAIWFGRQVAQEDVRLLALSLMSAGIAIRTIRPFDDPGRKANVIEVGADIHYANAPPLKLDYVRDATVFSR